MTAETTTPPPLHAPTSKEKKYDRQLRLWAASGQAALEDAHVLLVNSGCGAVGTETLKNLVLPGIGNFTVVDAATVGEEDLGVNFFLDEDSLGQSRAKCCCQLLEELNPDVQGHWIAEDIAQLVVDDRFLKPYTLILVTSPTPSSVLEIITHHAQAYGKAIFHIHSAGFYSDFSISLPPAFPIVDTHPDPASTTDLRLLNPWPELSQLVKEQTGSLETLDDHAHGHIPYVLLLLHYLEEWKASHDGKPPQNYGEKTKFRELVRAGTRTNNAEGGEENFDEAVAAVLKSLNPPTPSSGVKDVFAAPECAKLTTDSANFWIIAHAIRQFYETNDVLPLSGSVPDMKAQSADYIRLQNIYKTKARKDVAEVLQTVRSLEQSLGRPKIPEQEVEAFCKGAGFVKLVRGRPLHIPKPGVRLKFNERARFAAQELRDPETLLPIYLVFRAYDIYMESTTVKPYSGGASLDATELYTLATDYILKELWAENSLDFDDAADEDVAAIKERVEKVAKEIARSQGGELHNIAALTGGMVAQEVIKVVTKQYVPVDNTCVFDGIGSRTGVMRL